MHKLFWFFCGMLVWPTFGQDPMTDGAIKELKHLVSKNAQDIQSIQSDFTQYKHLDFLSNDIVTHGKMWFKTPDRVKWQYTEPYTYTLIFSGDRMHIEDQGKKSSVDMGASKQFQKLNELIVNSVRGDMFGMSDFEVSFMAYPEYYEATFRPKDKKIAHYIASFVLSFDRTTGMVQEVKMIEPSSDYTRIVFTNRSINGDIPDAIFDQ